MNLWNFQQESLSKHNIPNFGILIFYHIFMVRWSFKDPVLMNFFLKFLTISEQSNSKVIHWMSSNPRVDTCYSERLYLDLRKGPTWLQCKFGLRNPVWHCSRRNQQHLPNLNISSKYVKKKCLPPKAPMEGGVADKTIAIPSAKREICDRTIKVGYVPIKIGVDWIEEVKPSLLTLWIIC